MEHRIKDLIKEKKYTQQEFADILGITRVGLVQSVNGKPSYPTLRLIGRSQPQTGKCFSEQPSLREVDNY